jgi:hypothetical protein
MTPASLLKFLNAARSLAKQGFKQEDIIKFAKQEFGEVTDLVRLQINKIFKTKNQPSVGIKTKDPVFDNTVETIPFDDTGTPFNRRNPQKVYGKPKNQPLDPDDVLPNYNETPGEFARRQTPGSKENILEQMKAAYPQRYNNLTGNETAAELKGIMEKANKTDVPFGGGSGRNDLKQKKGRTVLGRRIKKQGVFMEDGKTPDYEYYGDILDDSENTFVNGDETIGELEFMLKEREAEIADMYDMYKTGKLDPVAGDKSQARKNFLQNKLDEAEASGDNRLITRDEMDELESFDFSVDDMKLSTNDEIKKGVDEIMSDTSPAALRKSIEVDNLMLEYPGMSRELAKQIANDPDPKRKADILSMVQQTIKMGDEGMSGDEIIDIFKKGTDRTKQAKGGRIKMAKGGLPNILGF